VPSASALEFESNELTMDDRTGEATLTGNVTVWDDTGTIKANRIIITYASSGDTVISYEAFGNVRIDYDDLKANSNYAYRDARADTLFLQQDAYVNRRGNEFWADRIRVDLRTSEVNMIGSVRGNVRSRQFGSRR
jgi:lipopolysaccharide export system protein LptA